MHAIEGVLMHDEECFGDWGATAAKEGMEHVTLS
jgi:hypothetical protein